MIYYKVKKIAHNWRVYSTSLNRKVSECGYYSRLQQGELLTYGEYKKVCLSGLIRSVMFEPVELKKEDIIKTDGRRFILTFDL